jgi:hypothetical protein
MPDTKQASAELPAALPADGKGFSKHLIMHINFGDDGGAANYNIKGIDRQELPITYQYDTRKDADYPKAFFIDGVEQAFKSWAELVAYWPTFIAERSQ